MRILVFLILSMHTLSAQTEITTSELSAHIAYFSSDKNLGRYAGGKTNKALVRYIEGTFKAQHIPPYGKHYAQAFKTSPKNSNAVLNTWNVIGYLEGNDPKFKDEIIVLGAHYDHLGTKVDPQKAKTENIFHGADDNASGISALLEISGKLATNVGRLKRSVLFIAFGAEELGLKGSAFFVENPVVSLSRIKLMINMDMVGRLNAENPLYIGGAGTFPEGSELLKKLGDSLKIKVFANPGDVGGSDHVSFYKKRISVLGLHTGGHPQYHTPEDTADLINLEGEKHVCDYAYALLLKVATTAYPLEFISQD